MGLRHLVVVDDDNQVTGMITRKDLLGFEIEKKIHNLINHSMNSTFRAYSRNKENVSAVSVVVHEATSSNGLASQSEIIEDQPRVSTV